MVSYDTPEQIHQAYVSGVPGWIDDPRSRDDLILDGYVHDGLNYEGAPEGLGDGKRVMLWRYRERFDPGAFGRESQDGPDCTSHGTRSAIDMTRCSEIILGKEPEEYSLRTATETGYGSRSHRGAGSDPAELTRFTVDYGFLARKNYPGVVDLSEYDFSIGDRWGGGRMPQSVKELCKEHSAGRWIHPKTARETRDAMCQGWGIHSGQQLGFRKVASSKGISEPITRGSGAWNHDMATGGYDDSKEIWPFCVWFILNSWALWNQRPEFWTREIEAILGPWIPGMILTTDDIYERYMVGTGSIYGFADVNGYPQRTLDSLGGTGW